MSPALLCRDSESLRMPILAQNLGRATTVRSPADQHVKIQKGQAAEPHVPQWLERRWRQRMPKAAANVAIVALTCWREEGAVAPSRRPRGTRQLRPTSEYSTIRASERPDPRKAADRRATSRRSHAVRHWQADPNTAAAQPECEDVHSTAQRWLGVGSARLGSARRWLRPTASTGSCRV